MKYIDAEKLIAEIRKWRSIVEERCPESTRSRDYTKEEWNAIYEYNAYTRILSFLDTLPDEPVMDCHDLKEAAEKSARQYYVDGGYSPFPNTERASHIAGFIAGAEWQKREMMEGAVEGDGEVCKLADRVWITPTDEKRFHQDVFDNFKSGDKVRIIILPEEEDNDRTIV